jgi:glycopeptide antibiotics resistance protein
LRLSRLSFVPHTVLFRWALTLAWTAIDASIMLSPGNSGTTVSWLSKSFGGTEITDAVGHIIINTLLALLWCWTLHSYFSDNRTTRLILAGGIVWCVGAELLQYFVPERGVSLLDIGANVLGIFIGLTAYRWLTAFLEKRL